MEKLTQIIIGLASLIAILTSCNNNTESSFDIFTKVYSVDNIQEQIYSINANIDNIITGESGTKIRINSNTFLNTDGQLLSGIIEIHLKEALTMQEMVLGNLTTTFDGKPLETGGMIFIDAYANDKKLTISKSKEILVALPTDSILTDMSLFSGQQDSLGVKWGNPIPLPRKEKFDSLDIDFDFFEKTTNITYTVDGFEIGRENYPDTVNLEVSRIAWEGAGLKIKRDSVFKIGEYTVRFYKNEKLQKWDEISAFRKGNNLFAEDRKTNYIFSIKKLGWANIDRLLKDPRTKDVELITSIDNENDFKFIYVTLVTQNMYLPGYQKKDNTFCFSHNDDEKQQLPVGEIATILATAYKNDKPYFAIQKIKIRDKQTIKFKLEETTSEKLKEELLTKI
ncbi:MAG: hypothetical protein GC192_18125 [Bacteroidetes bacterium]|nr:hypothetical protein [Bacteroidota bacterium]